MSNKENNTSVIQQLTRKKAPNLLAFSLTFGCTIMVVSSVVQATDLQIYAPEAAGQKTIVLMLDTSGSMGSVDSSAKASYSNRDDFNSIYKDYGIGRDCRTDATGNNVSSGTTPAYIRKFCTVNYSTNPSSNYQKLKETCEIQPNNGGLRCYDRLTRLKDGLFSFLNSSDGDARNLIPDAEANISEVFVGIGNFSANGDGRSAQIIVPAKKLEALMSGQRVALKTAVAGLTASNGTPSAHAFAEAASYLMGTTSYSNASYSGMGASKRNDASNPGIIVNRSVADDKAQYQSPLPSEENKASCDGQGVYFLSDGQPNSSSDAIAGSMMQKSLGNKGSTFSCSNDLANTDSASAWRCMGAYAKTLFNPATNPKGRSIQTAFVGFGSEFAGNPTSASRDIQNACRISSRAYNDSNGNPPDDKCSPNSGSLAVRAPTLNSANTGRVDGYNYDGGYGNGGFFQASNSTDITKSVVTFINNLASPTPDPLSTGAISVPVDDLSPNGFEPYGYLRALKPSPGKNYLVWGGNLKKYNIADGALSSPDGSNKIFDSVGALNKNTYDLWSASKVFDDGNVEKGGVFSQLSLPIITAPNSFRPLFTDVASASSGSLTKISTTGSSLLAVTGGVTDSQKLLDKLNTDNTLKGFTTLLKVKLLNYLGYDLDLATTTSLPTSLTAPVKPFTSMGGSIHSFPVQLTYSGVLDADGNLTSARSQSVLYGSMEGGLRIVDSVTGKEKMVFVPADILSDVTASSALRRGEAGGIAHGVSGAWVADAAYDFGETTDAGTSSVKAKQMNIFGGMRMGGSSYYGLNVLTPSDPKFLFRIGPDLGGKYARMGQSWSKPVIANVRYNSKIKRVMFIGGGYDMCYENPQFKLGTENPAEYGGGCNKSVANGNAVYMIDTSNGEVLWYASNVGADTNNANMKHSIVSRISTLDRDADGLVDHLYFGDLGGQVFRADFNNAYNTVASKFGVRVVRMADLGSTTIANGDQPRFYQPPTVTKHTENGKIFILVGIASGDRSTPLDVSPKLEKDRVGILPSKALSDRPVNNVYGLIDSDFANKDLMTITDTALTAKDVVLSQLIKNPQTLSNTVSASFYPMNSLGYKGWYRSLSSDYTGSEVRGRTAGGVKMFEEEPVAITSYLILPTYDPEGTGVAQRDPCKPRIIGETDWQSYCLPYGTCVSSKGSTDIEADKLTGFQMSADGKNLNVIGAGIRSLAFGPKGGGGDGGKNSCGSITMLGNIKGSGEWVCTRILNPLRWYEKNVTAN